MAMTLDASMALSWCFPDEASPYAERVLGIVNDSEAIVPAIWPLEVANGLLIGERRRRLTVAEMARGLELLLGLPIQVRECDLERSLGAIRMLASERGLSVYDASYLDLAAISGLPLATGDRRLREAALALGVAVVQ